jgi:membrane protein
VGLSAAAAIRSVLTHAHDPASGGLTTVVASVLLLFAATSVFAELKDSLDEIWGVPQPLYSGIVALIRTRLLSFALVVLLAALLLLSLLTSAALAVLENFAAEKWSNAAAFYGILSSLSAFGIIACLFAVVYKMLPDAALSWSDVWIGAAVTAGLFSLGKYAISLYLAHSVVASTFGAAGSVIALLLWIYYSAQIFLLGAQFTRQYALRFGSHRPGRHPSPEAESRSGVSRDPGPPRQAGAR